MIWVSTTSGELFYLRVMLTISKGSTSFEDIWIVGGKLYPTFRDACFAMGLLQYEREYIEAIKETND